MTRRNVITLGLVLATFGSTRADQLPEGPFKVMNADRLAKINEAVGRAVEDKKIPGAVVLVGCQGQIADVRAFGNRSIEPDAEEMTRDTIFDLASLTKPIATATSIMLLVERGQLRLDDKLGKLLPEFDNKGKGEITVDQLLRHRSGLIADNPLSDYADGPAKAWERLAALELVSQPGEKFVYSDVGFMILGRIVEKVSGQPLDGFSRENIFEPLGMKDTRFLPLLGEGSKRQIAPTERADGEMLRGRVHDPRARALGGVAGHAGLFGTADDLAIYAQMVLNGGWAGDKVILAPLTTRKMIDPADTPPGQRRGLGWDVATSFSHPRGSLFGPWSFGHTGFTGTSIWMDPETDAFVILLTSRLHPDGKGASPMALRWQVATLAASAVDDGVIMLPVGASPDGNRAIDVSRDIPPAIRPVTPGIDLLIQHGFAELKGRRVGLVTNHTGRTKDNRSTIDVLKDAPDVKLVALFSPEHGIRGLVDKEVSDDKDEKTGLPIFSLYGKTRKPTPESLEGIDTLVYDIQDIGTRFYTYISTLGLVLEAAKENGIKVVVLDRPNPIGGVAVEGPVRDPDFESFIAHHALPVRHGMTVGELARMFNAERNINADLTVVACAGWRRADLFDRTGLVWVNPSPNMRSLTEALLYPGVGLLEASNLATGRGTDTPFERVGAPWIDPAQFAKALNEQRLLGVRFVPIRFTPTERQYAGKECGGVNILIERRDIFEPIDLGVGMAYVLHKTYPNEWQPDGFLKMLADRHSYQQLLDGRPHFVISRSWRQELEDFLQVRQKYLIY